MYSQVGISIASHPLTDRQHFHFGLLAAEVASIAAEVLEHLFYGCRGA